MDVGGAPPHTDNLIRSAAGGRRPNRTVERRRASGALALFFWRSDSLEHGLNISEATLPVFAATPYKRAQG